MVVHSLELDNVPIKGYFFDTSVMSNIKAYIKIKDFNGKDVFCDIGAAYRLYQEGKKFKRDIANSDLSIYRASEKGFLPEDYYSRTVIAEKNIALLQSVLKRIEEEEIKEESQRDFSFLQKGMIKEEDNLIEL